VPEPQESPGNLGNSRQYPTCGAPTEVPVTVADSMQEIDDFCHADLLHRTQEATLPRPDSGARRSRQCQRLASRPCTDPGEASGSMTTSGTACRCGVPGTRARRMPLASVAVPRSVIGCLEDKMACGTARGQRAVRGGRRSRRWSSRRGRRLQQPHGLLRHSQTRGYHELGPQRHPHHRQEHASSDKKARRTNHSTAQRLIPHLQRTKFVEEAAAPPPELRQPI
jgi:hypothetical protein